MLNIDGLSKVYTSRDKKTTAIDLVTMTIQDGEFCSVVGPSGCGKTTLLRCIAGLLPASSGSVTFDGVLVDRPLPGMAVVFQDYSRSLLPWLSVAKNVALPLKGRSTKAARTAVTAEALAAVGLNGFADHYPWQLSGGMQQRTAIARALAFKPKILLLDEPMASVDAQTRNDLEDLLLKLRTEFKITILLVTHDIDESVYVSDRVVILTPPPTRVRESLTIDLPYPRDQIGTKSLPMFTELRSEVYSQIVRGNQTISR